MSGWDEAWLKGHQARMASSRTPPVRSTTLQSVTGPDLPTSTERTGVGGRAAVAFTLSRPTPLLNELLRMHWAMRRKHCYALSAEIAALLGVRLASPPIEHAIITVTRYSVGMPDADALTAKSLLDTLQPRSERHPYGLGVIAGDDPAHLTLHLSAVLCHKRKEQRTEVQIAAIG